MRIITTFIFLLTLSFSCSNNSKVIPADSKSKCSENNGYWYNDKCWYGFEDQGISKTKIDSISSYDMSRIENAKIIIDNKTYPLLGFVPIGEENGYTFIATYGTRENYKTLLFLTEKNSIKEETFESKCLFFLGDLLSGNASEEPLASGIAQIKIVDFDKLEIEIEGSISSITGDKSAEFSFKTNHSLLGAGNSHLEIKESEAFLSGTLGTQTYIQIKDLIKNAPDVKIIVLTQVSGSVNDAVNMHTGRLLNENGFTTKLLSDSDIASGGVDLFCSGKKRIVEKGAKIGIHSWCCEDDKTAVEIPKDHPAHQYQIEFFTMALGAEIGPDFYFYTLEAAPFNDIHYMTEEEIKKWNIATSL